MMDYKLHTLRNGLRIIVAPMPQARSVTSMIFLGVGSRYEPENLAGISHFIEHTVFKGTKKRPTSLDISSEIEGLGGKFNAATGHEYTCFWTKIAPQHFGEALDVVVDVALKAQFPEKELERERGVIMEEINMIEDTPPLKVLKDFLEFAWAGHPVGRRISGTKKTVSAITRKDILHFAHKNYTPTNMAVSIAGNIRVPETLEKVNSYFGDLAPGKKALFEKVEEAQKEPRSLLLAKKTQQTHFCLGVKALPRGHPDRYTLALANVILGRGLSSRLFTALRERLGLAYYISSSYHPFWDAGIWFARAGVKNSKTLESIRAVLAEFKRLASEPVGNKELRKAKEYAKGTFMLEVETSDGVSSHYGFGVLLEEEVLTPEEHCQKIEAVTARDIQRVAKDIVKPNKLNLALIGPVKEKGEIEKILR